MFPYNECGRNKSLIVHQLTKSETIARSFGGGGGVPVHFIQYTYTYSIRLFIFFFVNKSVKVRARFIYEMPPTHLGIRGLNIGTISIKCVCVGVCVLDNRSTMAL